MKIGKAVKTIVLWGLILAAVGLIVTSIIVRDYSFIVEHPFAFCIELVFFSVVCSLIIAVVFARTRKISIKEIWTWFFAMVLKFAAFHILFQLSGVYTVLLYSS